MIIHEPRINFANTQRAFRKFAARYNEGKESSEQLKPAHFAQLYTYVRLLERNIAQNNNQALINGTPKAMAIDTYDLPHLYTNNTEMRKQLDGGHTSTFIRRAERLTKAGAIQKINHGPVRNYEIIINPHLLFIMDMSGSLNTLRPSLEKAESWNSTGISGNPKVAKCEQNIVSFQKKLSNKEINNQAESFGNDSSQKDTKKDTGKDTTGNLAKNDFGDSVLAAIKLQLEQKKAEKDVPPATYAERVAKREKEAKQLRMQYATMMVQMMIDYLLKDQTVFDGERKRAISYVSEHYFSQCITLVSIQRAWNGYAQRLEDARRFKETHLNYTPYPYHYFQMDNPKGFNSSQWKKNKVNWKKQRRNQSEQQKLMAAIRRINKNPNRESLQREIEYVKNNIPDKLKGFFKIVYDTHGELMQLINRSNSYVKKSNDLQTGCRYLRC